MNREQKRSPNRYERIIETIFNRRYVEGGEGIEFSRDELAEAAHELGVPLPKNLGDLVYSFRYRTPLPESVREKAPPGKVWIIRPAGPSRYRFVAVRELVLAPNPAYAETRLPDATPGVIATYALTDEQALLARLRYNRLVDIFTGVTCYSLQSHLRTSVPGLGQVETDEIYIGLDRRGAHYVIPVQAKGGNDRLSVVQIEQDFALCAAKFPNLIARPIAAQFMAGDVIALFEFEMVGEEVRVVAERHYRLTPPGEVTPDDLQAYASRPLS
ncbi:MAG: endonuclease [Armatimonadetes bacterium]|nr:endonuclease [Armatimonadota bacterium]